VRAAAEKVRHWDHRVAKGFMEELPEGVRDALSRSYRALPSVADDARRYARRILGGTDGMVEKARTLGLVPTAQARTYTNTDLSLFDLAIDASAVRHIDAHHGTGSVEHARGQLAIAADDYAKLPTIVEHGTWATAPASRRSGEEAIQIVYRVGDVEYVTIWDVRRGARSLALKTFYVRVRAPAG
jgi:hypothetical protein